MEKLKILIVEDHLIQQEDIETSFIKKTFLHEKVEVIKLSYLQQEYGEEESLEYYLKDKGNQVDFILLDLSFDEEGIISDHKTTLKLLHSFLKFDRYRPQIILVSDEGASSPDTYHNDGFYRYPMISKSARQEHTNTLITREFELWQKHFIVSLTYTQLQIIRSNIIDEFKEKLVDFNGRKLALASVFANCSTAIEAYDITSFKPPFEFEGWDEPSKLMKFKLAVKKYYSEMISNPKWFEEVKYWNGYLSQYLKALALIDLNKSQLGDKYELYSSFLDDCSFIWDTKELPSFTRYDTSIKKFIKRYTERRFILFQYLFYETEILDIYHQMNGAKESPSETTIGNGLRYTYFISDLTYKVDLESRIRSYDKVFKQLTHDDKMLFRHIIESLYDEFSDRKIVEKFYELINEKSLSKLSVNIPYKSK